jgi:tetratricopeptide (TPR) repeat protein
MNQIDEWLKQAGDLANEDKVDEAADMASRVLMLEPDNFKALFVIGSVMLKVGRNVQAQQFLRRVAELRPAAHQSWGNLAISCGEMHRYEESIGFAEKAIKCKISGKKNPDPKVECDDWCRVYADASFAHSTGGNWAKGAEYARKALSFDPQFKDAIFHLATCNLALQNWVEGWAGFKVSEGGKWRKLFTYGDTKEWMGEPDAIVMVTGEQGLGDEVIAAGMIPDAIRACTKFIFDCDKRIAALFERSFPEAIVVPMRQAKTVALPIMPTHHKTLFGLGQLFRTTNASFPRAPYLVPNPDYLRMFRELFGNRRMVGVAWSGGYPRTGQVERTAGLSSFLPLFQGEKDATYLSLQYRDDAAEIVEFEQKTGCKIMRLPWVMGNADIDLLAACIAALDEVVGVHTTALHLSSAMGVPTTTLTHRGSGWRYYPDEMLWYPPTTRLWKKDRGESWRECVGQLTRHRRERQRAAA